MEMQAEHETRMLIEKARSGDRGAFDALARAHRERLLAFIRTRLGSRVRGETEAEDILQETYLKATESLQRFEWRGADSLFAWLATIAEYIIRRLGRSPKRAVLPLDRDRASSGPSPSRILGREERLARLEAALETLDEDQRTAIRLARIEGLRIAEVAERMGRTPGAVRYLLRRGLQQLRSSFGLETESLHLPEKTLSREEGGADGD